MEFLDTNVLIYAHDRNAGDRQTLAANLLSRLLQENALALSTQVLLEFYSAATRKLHIPSEQAQTIIEDFGVVELHRPSHANIVSAIQFSRRTKTSWWDSLILTSALDLECSILWTEDLSHNQRFGSLTVKNPFR